MNYKEAIDYLYAQLPVFSRVGISAYKADLNNITDICNALNNPQNNFKTIHIAGTNGKGSTSHMLAAILQQAGYKTGLYTSPHVKDFRERIKVNGKEINKKFVTNFVNHTKEIIKTIEPSFFELTVGMAFCYFSIQNVDVAIIETGLGGRLDSTNIINPILSIITNIGFDHVNILGNTLSQIAKEKAGIIKKNTPIIIGEYLPETKPVFIEKAAQENAPIYFAQDKYKVSNITQSNTALNCSVTDMQNSVSENFELDLSAIYQTKNLCTVLQAEEILQNIGFNIKSNAEKYALANTKKITGLLGRWQIISLNPMIVIDVAHNEDGMKQILHQLSDLKIEPNHIHFVLGMVKEKDVETVLSLMPKTAQYYFTNAHIPRAMPHAELQEKALLHRLLGNSYDDVNDAISHAKNNLKENDIIVVCGSFFVVAEVDF